MKKIIPVFLILLLFSGCKMRDYTPVINEDFKCSAIYTTGDFSFSCDIEKKGDTINITPTSTRAKGMVISCNGREVALRRNNLVNTFDVGEIDKTNPAVLLHQVFANLDAAEVNLIEGAFTYSGRCSLGNYILKQGRDNKLISLAFPQADISITFS